MKSLISFAAVILVIGAASLLGIAAHEGGHALVGLAYGGKITYFEVLTGFQLYPQIALVPWTRSVARLGLDLPSLAKWQHGLLALAGSGLTALLSYPALIIGRKQRGWSRLFWLWLGGLLAVDIVAYSLLPLIGVSHWIFFGGTYPEPYAGAQALGLPAWAYFTLLAGHTLAAGALLIPALRWKR